VALATSSQNPEYPWVDDTHVYWTNTPGVHRVAKNVASTIESFDTTGSGNEAVVGGSGGYAYWVDATAQTVYRNHLGGLKQSLATGQSQVQTLAVDATHVYWAFSGGIRRTLLEGGSFENVASSSGAYAIAILEDDVFWVTIAGQVFRAPKGTNQTGLPLDSMASAAGSWTTVAIAIHGGTLFWSYHYAPDSSGGVRRVDLGGANAADVAENQHMARAVAADASCVYWVALPDGANSGPGFIRARRRDLSAGVVDIAPVGVATGLVSDGSAIYWTDTGSSASVVRLPM
jgi:hypothetical protein